MTSKMEPSTSSTSMSETKKATTSWLRIQPGGVVPTCGCNANSILPDLSVDKAYKEVASFAENWSPQDVFEFVQGLGFTKEAKAFYEQEIDGQALLLLKRSDVLSRLSLRLGPALKLHRRILAVQTAYARTRTSN